MEDILSGDSLANYSDNVHPGPAGFEIMSDSWYSALVPVLDEETEQEQEALPWEIFMPAIQYSSRQK